MHGAAMDAEGQPHEKASSSRCGTWRRPWVSPLGRRSSQRPKRLAAKTTMTAAMMMSTNRVLQQGSMRLPVKAAATPKDELVRARPKR